jgi:HK97 family phage portal protein
MLLPIVYTCVSLLSRTVAVLPLTLYRRLERGKEKATSHALYNVLRDSPNPEMTAYDFHACLMGHLCLWGNAYAEIVRDSNGDVVQLWPLPPNRVTSKRIAPGKMLYEIQTDDGPAYLRGENVLHFRNLSTDGRRGYSFVRQAREEIALGMSAREYGARYFSADGRPGGVLKHPASLTPDTIDRLRSSWEAAHGGLSNSHKVAILEEGMEWQSVGLPPEDMQFLQTREFTRKEIAGWFHIPPHMVGDTERSTSWGSGIEAQGQGFLTFTLMPWLVSLQQEVSRSLLTAAERTTYFVEHLTNALLKTDIQTRYQAYAQGRNWGWLSANDIRELENLNPIDGGDIYLSPLNMGNADVMTDWPKTSQSQIGTPAPSDQPAIPPPGQTTPKSIPAGR